MRTEWSDHAVRRHAMVQERVEIDDRNIDLMKAIEARQNAERIALDSRKEAAELGALVNDSLAWMGAYRGTGQVWERTGVTLKILDQIPLHCVPIFACLDTQRKHVCAFTSRPRFRHGLPSGPGWRIVMTDRSQPATPVDKTNIAALEHAIMNCGFTTPPDDEWPEGWDPSFESLTAVAMKDTLTLDQVGIVRWPSKTVPDEVPVACWAPEDGTRIQRPARTVESVKDGVPKHEDYRATGSETADIRTAKVINWCGEPTKHMDRIDGVLMSDSGRGGTPVKQYTRAQLAVWVRNYQNRHDAHGYGMSEVEVCTDTATAWIKAFIYNSSRMDRDSLPRGILTAFGNFNEQQLMGLRLHWKQMCEGVAKRWAVPLVTGLPTQGSSMNWTPIDLSARDMEYINYFYTTSVFAHAIFGVDPSETGFDSTSPFPAPLSEASPDLKLKMLKDRSLGALLRSYEQMVNRQLLWPCACTKRYSLEFVGLGDVDLAQHVDAQIAELNGGLTTPREVWAANDMVIPEALRDHPAWDLPMPIAQGLQYVEGLRQQDLAEQQQKQQSAMQEEQQGHSREMDRANMMGGNAQQEPGRRGSR